MKGLYIVYSDENKKTGLFNSTHARIKYSKPYLENIRILNIRFYDNIYLRILKRIFGKKITKKDKDYFIYDGLKYENIWLKRGIRDSVAPLPFRNKKIFFNEKLIDNLNIKKLIKDDEYNFIMAHFGYPYAKIAENISKTLDIPFFITFHGGDINVSPFKNKLLRTSLEKSMNSAKLNIFVSKALMEKSFELNYKKNSIVINNGVDKEFFLQKEKKEKNISKIIFIGNLIEDKRADKLVKIFELIKEKNKAKELTFEVIGEGKYKKSMIEESLEKKININFCGTLNKQDVIKKLKESEILILPSRREGMPLVILEALAAGVIPIASNVGGIKEILENEYLVDEGPEFIEKFAIKVTEVLEKRKYPKIEIKDFLWDKIAKREIDIIRENLK